ncbi:MAG TPA: rhodanese-like domain-containing protein [Patescibacteria group bacterium]|nr:rhodanese-like domain-containing protein [Patescibacteria group bacterium]
MPSVFLHHERDKKAVLVGAVLILFIGVYFIGKSLFFRNDTPPSYPVPKSASQKEGVPLIPPDILIKKIQTNETLALLDIRDATSFQTEHIPQSFVIPINALGNFAPNQNELVVIIFAESDTLTLETAKNIMGQKSFPYFFLKGGFEGWKAMGAPTISMGDPKSFLDQSKVALIDVEAYKKLISENNPSLLTLDVQTDEAFAKKHLKGALHIPLNQLEKRFGEIPAGRQIIVYGENDLTSFQGGVRIFDLGIFSARVLTGNNYLSPESGLLLEP